MRQPRAYSRLALGRVMHSMGVLGNSTPVLWQLLALKAEAELQGMELQAMELG